MTDYKLLILNFKTDILEYDDWTTDNFIDCMYTYHDVTQYYKNFGRENKWIPLDDII